MQLMNLTWMLDQEKFSFAIGDISGTTSEIFVRPLG